MLPTTFANEASMSVQNGWRICGRHTNIIGMLLFVCPALVPNTMPAARADDQPAQTQQAKSVGPTAALVRRAAMGQPWQVVKQGEALPAGQLLVGMHGAAIESADGGVRLTMTTDLDGNAPYPVVESAVTLRDNSKVDLDFILDRGRVDLVNRKAKGTAHVRVQVRQATWNLTLSEPQTRVALLLYGRWARGTTFNPKPGPKDVPIADLVFLVIHGGMELEHNGKVFEMHNPPGPALMEWDSVSDEDDSPTRLDKLPDWAKVENANSPKAQATIARQRRLRALVQANGIEATIRAALNSDDETDRRTAVNAMAALDDLHDLGAAMRETKHPDVINNGILALRRWIGRCPGQDQILYKKLIEVRHMSPVHAATVVQLLHSFGDEELARPETYQMLIAYLNHSELPIRALAYWHLWRLVPAGRKLGYEPRETKGQREAAIRKWEELVPPGKMPPRASRLTK